jgi:hypothetical protein
MERLDSRVPILFYWTVGCKSYFWSKQVDIRNIFKEVSDQLLSEFRKSSEVIHAAGKGDLREDAFRDFLRGFARFVRYPIDQSPRVGRVVRLTKSGIDEIVSRSKPVTLQQHLMNRIGQSVPATSGGWIRSKFDHL